MKQQSTSNVVAVDIGNSSLKAALFAVDAGPQPHPEFTVRIPNGAPVSTLAAKLPATACHWAVVSVNRTVETTLATWVRTQRPGDYYQLLQTADFPLRIAVEFPERVGNDRLAAAVAANQLRCHAQPAIVIDSGTAITVDLVDVAGTFCGGVILAGPAIAAAALATHTDALPLVRDFGFESPPAPVGRSTEEAIRSGLVWGTIGALKELVARFSAGLAAVPHVFCTGPGAESLVEHLGSEAQYDPLLVFRGIIYTTIQR